MVWLIICIRKLIVSIFHGVKFGKKVIYDGRCEFKGKNIVVGDNSVLCKWSCFRTYGGFIKIGSNCSVNSFCHISGNGGITIMNNVRIASHCTILSANHNFNSLNRPIYLQGETKEKTIIENDCWLGSGVKVLAGVRIGTGSVIGAGAVVTRDIPPYSVAVGVPAKVIRSRIDNNRFDNA